MRLIEMCKETTMLKKNAIEENKAKFEVQLDTLDREQAEAERSNKRAEKNLQKVKDEIEKLINESKKKNAKAAMEQQ